MWAVTPELARAHATITSCHPSDAPPMPPRCLPWVTAGRTRRRTRSSP
jgi:hypothetical protein